MVIHTLHTVTHVYIHSRNWEDLDDRVVPGDESVELMAVLVPLDRIEDLVL